MMMMPLKPVFPAVAGAPASATPEAPAPGPTPPPQSVSRRPGHRLSLLVQKNRRSIRQCSSSLARRRYSGCCRPLPSAVIAHRNPARQTQLTRSGRSLACQNRLALSSASRSMKRLHCRQGYYLLPRPYRLRRRSPVATTQSARPLTYRLLVRPNMPLPKWRFALNWRRPLRLCHRRRPDNTRSRSSFPALACTVPIRLSKMPESRSAAPD